MFGSSDFNRQNFLPYTEIQPPLSWNFYEKFLYRKSNHEIEILNIENMKNKDRLNTATGDGYLAEDSYHVHGFSTMTHDGSVGRH
jgi:hypothetical protein